MEARLLRILVIDDVLHTLATGDLEPVKVPRYRSSEPSLQLQSWEDYLALWAADDGVIRPELLVIDCNFDRDRRAPALTDGMVDDPRGLIYGAIHVARLRAMQSWAPFGFAVYSRDLGRFSEHAYALTCFGVITAMAGELPAFDGDESVQLELQRRMIEHPSVTDPSGAWPHALGGYRRRLDGAFQALHAHPDVGSFQAGRAAVESFAAGGAAPAEDLAVKWSCSFAESGQEHVLLRSLFADCRRHGAWDRSLAAQVALPWLCDAVAQDWQAQVTRPVSQWFADLSAGNQPELKLPRGRLDAGRMLAMTVLWAYYRAMGKDCSVTRLQSDLGIESSESSRALRNTITTSTTAGGWNLRDYLHLLADLPSGAWPPPLPSWVRVEAREILMKRARLTPAQLPPCLR